MKITITKETEGVEVIYWAIARDEDGRMLTGAFSYSSPEEAEQRLITKLKRTEEVIKEYDYE